MKISYYAILALKWGLLSENLNRRPNDIGAKNENHIFVTIFVRNYNTFHMSLLLTEGYVVLNWVYFDWVTGLIRKTPIGASIGNLGFIEQT